jgi:hypothetical protein
MNEVLESQGFNHKTPRENDYIFKGFEDQSDTYHDTQTRYLMEQDPFLLQDQAEVRDASTADKVEALKNERMEPPGPCSS